MTQDEPRTAGSQDGNLAPLYQQIKRWIRDRVDRGDYDPEAPITTERALRERFDVSAATAVRALNDLVAEGILVRRRGLGTFVAETPAEPTSTAERGMNVAYIAYGHTGPHGGAIMQGISAVCLELGYRLFVTDTAPSHDLEVKAIRQAIDSNAAGVLWYPQDGPDDVALLNEVTRHDVPVVFVDRYFPGSIADAVVADNFAVGYRLTKELIDHGHSRIATLWSESQCTSVTERLSGHIQALREHGLSISSERTALRSYVDQGDDRRLTWLRGLLDGPDAPTAVLCANGFVLATVARDLISLGVSVPDDVDLAGMDDAGPFDLLPLASIAAHLPSHEMGETAMRRLHSRLTGVAGAPAEHIVLPINLRTRADSPIRLRPVSADEPPATTQSASR